MDSDSSTPALFTDFIPEICWLTKCATERFNLSASVQDFLFMRKRGCRTKKSIAPTTRLNNAMMCEIFKAITTYVIVFVIIRTPVENMPKNCDVVVVFVKSS